MEPPPLYRDNNNNNNNNNDNGTQQINNNNNNNDNDNQHLDHQLCVICKKPMDSNSNLRVCTKCTKTEVVIDESAMNIDIEELLNDEDDDGNNNNNKNKNEINNDDNNNDVNNGNNQMEQDEINNDVNNGNKNEINNDIIIDEVKQQQQQQQQQSSKMEQDDDDDDDEDNNISHEIEEDEKSQIICAECNQIGHHPNECPKNNSSNTSSNYSLCPLRTDCNDTIDVWIDWIFVTDPRSNTPKNLDVIRRLQDKLNVVMVKDLAAQSIAVLGEIISLGDIIKISEWLLQYNNYRS